MVLAHRVLGRCEQRKPVGDVAGGGRPGDRGDPPTRSWATGFPPLVHRLGKEGSGLCSDSTQGGPIRALSGSPMASSSLPS